MAAEQLESLINYLSAGPDGDLRAVLLETLQRGERALFILWADHRVANEMGRIEELELNIGGAEIPKSHKIVYVIGVPDEEPCMVPSGLHRVMPVKSVAGEIAEAWMFEHIHRDWLGLVKAAVHRDGGLRKNLPIVDADILCIRVCAVLQKESVRPWVVVVPDELPDTLFIDGFPFRLVVPMRKYVAGIEHLGAGSFIPPLQKKLPRDGWMDL